MLGEEIDHELQNIYANTVTDEVIYIMNAPSGRGGYFCMGCKNPMQAVRPVTDRKHHFRHDVTDVKYIAKCTYSDETYRHKIAKEILQQLKRIKVPALYKFSQNRSHEPMLLKQAGFIECQFVHNEVLFYEDDQGNVHWGQGFTDVKHLIIRADVAFFDKNYQPILIVEMVATHKPNSEKLLKLLRLGIDAVSVSIPKDSPESIATTFNTSTRTKWIYNYEQESTEYIQPPDRSPTGVPFIDEEQRKLFAESFKCRAAQINNLIRRITKCLESEQFGSARSRAESEISRLENNSGKLREELDLETESYRRRIDHGDSSAAGDFEIAKYGIESELLRLGGTKASLEKRYLGKAGEIEREAKVLDNGIERFIRAKGGDGKDFESRRTTYANKRDRIEHRIRTEEEDIQGNVDSRGKIEDKYQHLENELIREFGALTAQEERNIASELVNGKYLPDKYQRIREGIIRGHSKLKDAEEKDIREQQAIGSTLSERFETLQRELDAEFSDLRQSTVNALARGAFEANLQLSEGHRRIISNYGRVNIIAEKLPAIKRSRAIKQFLESGEYKVWI